MKLIITDEREVNIKKTKTATTAAATIISHHNGHVHYKCVNFASKREWRQSFGLRATECAFIFPSQVHELLHDLTSSSPLTLHVWNNAKDILDASKRAGNNSKSRRVAIDIALCGFMAFGEGEKCKSSNCCKTF